MATYVCSDIHGNFDAWLRALEESGIDLDSGDKLFILGDLIDRGNKSLQCVYHALDLRKKYPGQVIYLMGNHEKLFLDFVNIKDVKRYDSYFNLYMNGQSWLSNGGTTTVLSFLGDYSNNLVEMHEQLNQRFSILINELNDLPYYHIEEDYVYVHAGFLSNTQLKKQDNHDMIWIRDEFFRNFTPVNNDVLEDKIIVHGHTPVQYIRDYSGEGYYKGKHHICVDGGSALGKKIMIVKMDDLSYVSVSVQN